MKSPTRQSEPTPVFAAGLKVKVTSLPFPVTPVIAFANEEAV